MSRGTEHLTPGWTVDTLAVHFQRQHDDLVTLLDERFETQNRSLAAALESINERLAAANEIRASWQDDRASLPTRQEVDARFKPLESSDAQNTGRRVGASETKTGFRLDSSWLIGALALVVAAFAVLSR